MSDSPGASDGPRAPRRRRRPSAVTVVGLVLLLGGLGCLRLGGLPVPGHERRLRARLRQRPPAAAEPVAAGDAGAGPLLALGVTLAGRRCRVTPSPCCGCRPSARTTRCRCSRAPTSTRSPAAWATTAGRPGPARSATSPWPATASRTGSPSRGCWSSSPATRWCWRPGRPSTPTCWTPPRATSPSPRTRPGCWTRCRESPTREPTRALLTLTTCQDLFRSPDRTVAFGHLQSTRNKTG